MPVSTLPSQPQLRSPDSENAPHFSGANVVGAPPFYRPDELLAALVALPAPPGQEGAVCDYLAAQLSLLDIPYRVDAKGNLLACPGDTLPTHPQTVITAHMDEIALMVTAIEPDGRVRVSPLGGVYPWKWGEGLVEILPLGGGEPVAGVLSLGSIHTTSPYSAAAQARDGKSPTWNDAFVWHGESASDLHARGIRPGARVVMARERRRVISLGGNRVGSYFLDDRADCVAWLLALAELKATGQGANTLFVASTSEEVGGEGALFALHALPAPPAVCVALEIGPTTPDTPLTLDATPTVWITDSYATMSPTDLAHVYAAAETTRHSVQPQAVTRGGSDASIAANRGLCALPVTLAFAAENSHGFEIMHRDAPQALADLLLAYLKRLENEETR
ncbi:MAG: hypothetical protein H7Y38_14665 [Armatimonadetes bacterium]|nr:hypothetical protein [Armatimonadota bacterium]